MRRTLERWSDKLVPRWCTAALYLLFCALAFSIAGMELAIAMLALGFVAWRPFHPMRSRLPGWVLAPFGAFLAVAVLSAVTLPDPLRGLALVSRDYRIFIVPFLVLFALQWADEPKLLTVLAVVVIAVVGVGLVQYYVGELPLKIGGRNPIDPVGERFRAEGMFNNPLTYSGVLLVLSPLYAALALKEPADRRWFWAATCLLAAVGVVISITRSSLLAMSVAFLALTLGLNGRLRARIWIALAVLGVAAIILLATAEGLYRPPDTFEDSEVGVEDFLPVDLPPFLQRFTAEAMRSGAHARLYLWESGWLGFWDHPWLGVGLNNHYPAILAYQEQVAAKHPDFDFGRSLGASSHNMFITLLFELGALGLASYVWLWIAVMTWTLRAMAKAPLAASWERKLLLGIAAGFVGTIVASIFEDNFVDAEVQTLLMTLMGLSFHIGLRLEGHADGARAGDEP